MTNSRNRGRTATKNAHIRRKNRIKHFKRSCDHPKSAITESGQCKICSGMSTTTKRILYRKINKGLEYDQGK